MWSVCVCTYKYVQYKRYRQKGRVSIIPVSK